MPRSSESSKAKAGESRECPSTRKGQWFLVSAVLATGTFLAISLLFRSYFISDPSAEASTAETFYFNNIKEQVDYLVQQECGQPAFDFDRSFAELSAVAARELGDIGYGLKMGISGMSCVPLVTYDLDLVVASSAGVVCQGYSAAEMKQWFGADVSCA